MTLPNEVFIILFINALASTYPVWADRQRSRSRVEQTAPNLEFLMEDITDEARIALFEAQSQEPGTGTILYTGKDARKDEGKSQDKGKDKGKDKRKYKCNPCGKDEKEEKCWIDNHHKAPSCFK